MTATHRGGAGGKRVLLVHGMGRTPLAMYGLARYLRRMGCPVEHFGYLAPLQSFAAITGRLRARLRAIAARGHPYVVIGHSLGGLLLRAALAFEPDPIPPPGHLVLLGTPGRPPRLAVRCQRMAIYRWLAGECGQALAGPDLFARLPPPRVPYTIIAGTRGWQGRLSPFGSEPNDGVVALSETRLAPDDRVVAVPVGHTFMMNSRQVRTALGSIVGG